MSLLKQFQQHWAEQKFVIPGQRVLLTVSGGIDSMVLAELFLKAGIPFSVAHCNFQLRGNDSLLDEAFVIDWCTANNVERHVTRFETKSRSEEWKKGTQETARILRYEWFEVLRKEHGFAAIVTAHHANDNVETMLINLFKGTGIAGMHGILPVSNNIIRPLLFAKKEEILAYAAENNITHREDSSNASDDYLRNNLRHNVVPAILAAFPNALTAISESIGRFAEAEVLYKKAVNHERKRLLEQRGKDFYIPVFKLMQCQPLATIVYELIGPFGFATAQVGQVISLMNADTGHYITSSSHRIIKNRDFLIITTLPAATADIILIEALPCVVETERYHFSFVLKETPEDLVCPPDTAYIDFEKAEFPLILRKWKIGDYFYPLGMNMKKKKVSRVLINDKIPIHEKEHVWVLESAKRIAWLAGMRLDERFKVRPNTRQVIVVKMKKIG
ncbi:MAG: tRNA lysidine(34) synthetase TilS [Taibaiella sp.]|nr:tRNA lysidine(34) synthetase TilS [Taibaiella sp.]